MKPLLGAAKAAVKRLLPYSPRRGVRPFRIPKDGRQREGVSSLQVFPPSTFSFGAFPSLKGQTDFPPYDADVPEYRMFVLEGGKFIFGREEAFTKRGRILEQMSAQKVNPLTGKRLDLTPGRRVRGRVLLLGLSGLEDGYYHFMIELLLRWWIFRRSGLEADYYVFSTRKPFQREALALLGISAGQMLEAAEGTVVQADRLLCPTLVNNFELSHLRGYELYNKLYMPSWTREAYSFLLGKGRSAGKADRLVYVSRNRSARRRILNEGDLLPILHAYGFETFYLEEMDLGEQMELFASARMVVAPHGAGLVNLVWSREGTSVLELYPEFYHDPSFRLLAAALRLDYHYAICKSPGAEAQAPVDEDILVDCLDLVEDFLREKLPRP